LEEYKTFVNQKNQMIELIKTMSKQLNDKMEEIQLTKLNKLFFGPFGILIPPMFIVPSTIIP
jgi:hypothetical protein